MELKQEILILTCRLRYHKQAGEQPFAKGEKRNKQGWHALKTSMKILFN